MSLIVKDLSKTYQQGKTPIKALDDLSFELKKGGSLSVVGPSGSGKTTLLTLLAGLDQADQGEILFNDKAVQDFSEKQWTEFRGKNIGIVFQSFYLMPHLTALENVSLPLELQNHSHSVQRATDVLKQVGLGDRTEHKPSQLSGGECQRVAIARALSVNPPFIFADEPSGNLDTDTGKKVMDLLFELVKQNEMTLLLITHDSKLAARCESQIHLVGGKKQ